MALENTGTIFYQFHEPPVLLCQAYRIGSIIVNLNYSCSVSSGINSSGEPNIPSISSKIAAGVLA